MYRTKLVFTLGPATDDPKVMDSLLAAGMDCGRFNFSHGDYDEHRRRYNLLQAAARRRSATVASLMDLAGPKLRVGRFEKGQIPLKRGETVVLQPGLAVGSEGMIPISYTQLAGEIKPGQSVLLDDGALRLTVDRIRRDQVVCKVAVGGVLRDRKGMNLPDLAVNLPAITAKDRKDLAFGLALGMDYVALSFVRSAQDMRQLRRLVQQAGSSAGLIAKIEKPQAIPHLEEIIEASDGIMVALGDLGVEMSPEQVPLLQKKIIALANRRGRFVITATQMLQSMVDNPEPTRAEASDVANAIFDGADAVMLSGEPAAGRYPAEAAAMMAKIANAAETSPQYNRLTDAGLPASAARAGGNHHAAGEADAVVGAGVRLAEQTGAQALVVFTHTGNTARLVSKHRPMVPVIALADDPKIQRRMQVYWGIESILMNRRSSMDAIILEMEKQLVKSRRVKPGQDVVIIASGVPKSRPNFLKLHKIGAKD